MLGKVNVMVSVNTLSSRLGYYLIWILTFYVVKGKKNTRLMIIIELYAFKLFFGLN